MELASQIAGIVSALLAILPLLASQLATDDMDSELVKLGLSGLAWPNKKNAEIDGY